MPIPPLAFGQHDAALTSDLTQASETMAQIVPSMKLSPTTKARTFRTKVATSSVGDIRLIAHAATPCRMEVSESKGWHLIAPYIGAASLRCDGNTFALRSGSSALLMPNMQRSTERAPCSVVIASIDIGRLQRTVAVMAGCAEETEDPLARPLSLQLERNREMFLSFLQICGMLDTTRNKQGLGKNLGIDDMLYRWMAASLSIGDGGVVDKGNRSAASSLDAVCDLIRSSQDRPLTLTEMEETSGLSARSLQKAFRSRFGCSPMSWQRRERMLEAQKRLMNLAPNETITMLAYALGFSSSAAFTTLYRKYFGETPSETVKRFR